MTPRLGLPRLGLPLKARFAAFAASLLVTFFTVQQLAWYAYPAAAGAALVVATSVAR